MQPRSIFDGFLVAVLGAIVYWQLIAPRFAWSRARAVADVVSNLGIAVYLILGGVAAIAALIYMFVYLPQKQSQNPAR
jgi:hypothetical protein